MILLSASSMYAGDPDDFSYSVGGNARFSAYTFDGVYYLILSFKDNEEYRLMSNPVVIFKFKDGNILKMDGSDSSQRTKTKSVDWGFGITSGSSSDTHYAVFPIEKDEIEKLKDGVENVVINTIPIVYKKQKWPGKNDFGTNLYKDFKNLKSDFEF